MNSPRRRFFSLCSSFLLPATLLSATFLFAAVPASDASAQTFSTLVNFTGSNGANPLFGTLIQGKDGNFYGTTSAGGAHGQGTVFKLTAAGTLTTIYNFCSKGGCADGSAPFAGLILAKDGNFYGTTEAGGSQNEGTVFKVTTAGKLTTLHSFTFHDGANPYAALMQAKNGTFYGTTESGGANLLGTVFKMTSAGVLSTLHSFNQTDGASPESPLIQGTDGNFYGTTYRRLERVRNGFQDDVGRRRDDDSHLRRRDRRTGDHDRSGAKCEGNFLRTTSLGGTIGYGSVFSMTSAGVVKVLHSFGATDGATPNALIMGSDGNLYGTTISGAAAAMA